MASLSHLNLAIILLSDEVAINGTVSSYGAGKSARFLVSSLAPRGVSRGIPSIRWNRGVHDCRSAILNFTERRRRLFGNAAVRSVRDFEVRVTLVTRTPIVSGQIAYFSRDAVGVGAVGVIRGKLCSV